MLISRASLINPKLFADAGQTMRNRLGLRYYARLEVDTPGGRGNMENSFIQELSCNRMWASVTVRQVFCEICQSL